MKRIFVVLSSVLLVSSTVFATELNSRCERLGWYDAYNCVEGDSSDWVCNDSTASAQYSSGYDKGVEDDRIDFPVGTGGCEWKFINGRAYPTATKK